MERLLSLKASLEGKKKLSSEQSSESEDSETIRFKVISSETKSSDEEESEIVKF